MNSTQLETWYFPFNRTNNASSMLLLPTLTFVNRFKWKPGLAHCLYDNLCVVGKAIKENGFEYHSKVSIRFAFFGKIVGLGLMDLEC